MGYLGIALAIGAPLILTINRQAASQAQLLLDQAVLSTRALLSSEQADLENLALLISQRPTLTQLLERKDMQSLDGYVETLREGANLDLLLICSDGKPQGNPQAAQLCLAQDGSGYVSSPAEEDAYLYAPADLEAAGLPAYQIITGKKMSTILAQLQRETGLLYYLVQQESVIRSSDSTAVLTAELADEIINKAATEPGSALGKRVATIAGHRYLPALLEIDPSREISLIAGLNIDNQIALQKNLSWTLSLGLLFVVIIASVLGVVLSQRISEPITQLATAAAEFRQGNLDLPVSIQSPVWEISQLTNTLEDARIALQHSLQQLQAKKVWNEHLLHSIVEGLVTLDAENRITFASDGLTKITGDEPEAVIGRKIDDVFLATEEELAFSSQLPDAGGQRRISARLKNDEHKLLSVSRAKLIPPEAEGAHCALVIRDVSNDETIHRLLGDFLANITHEFRTPLSALEASSELLLENFNTLSKAEIEELLVSLNLGITNLQTLIDNLIEAASIEAGRFKVSVRPIEFETIMREALEMIRPLANKYSLRLKPSQKTDPCLVLADQKRTVQVLVNLLSNAIKHSPEGGSIWIDHTVTGNKLRVEVRDEGRGITGEQRSDLFRRFAHMEPSSERARHGAGLGLSVVKAIVEAQRGEVGIKNLTEGGTTFWFTVPLANGAEQ